MGCTLARPEVIQVKVIVNVILCHKVVPLLLHLSRLPASNGPEIVFKSCVV